MILIDFSQVLHATLHQVNKEGLSLELARGSTLQALLSYKMKFSREWGPPVLAVDSNGGYWRREIFEHYKGTRVREREKQKDKVDWVLFKKIANTITKEVILTLPWKSVMVEGVEADDVIAVLSFHFGPREKTLILSSDKDFQQLHTQNVRQYSPILGKWIQPEQPPKKMLHDLILSGDSSDGIPNIRSEENALMEGIRQLPVTQKFKDASWEDPSLLEEFKERYELNKKLIDLTQIPEDVKSRIIESYNEPIQGTAQRMLYYFTSKRLSLMDQINSFIVKRDSYEQIHPATDFFQ